MSRLREIQMRLLELQALVEEELSALVEVKEIPPTRAIEKCELTLSEIVREDHYQVVNVVPYETAVGNPPANWVRVAIEYRTHKDLQARFTALKNEGCPCGGDMIEIISPKTGKFWGCSKARQQKCRFFPSFKWEQLKFFVNSPSERVTEYVARQHR